MLDGVTFYGRPLSLRPKIDDDSFYVYQQRLESFTKTLAENSSYWDKYLKPEEIKDRDTLRRKMEVKSKASSRELEKLENRYFQYAKHCELRNNYNPHINIRFGDSYCRAGGKAEGHHYNRHSYEPYRREYHHDSRYSNVNRLENRSQPQSQAFHNGNSSHYNSSAQHQYQQHSQHHRHHRHSLEQHHHHHRHQDHHHQHHLEFNNGRNNEECNRRQGHYHRQHQPSRYQRPY